MKNIIIGAAALLALASPALACPSLESQIEWLDDEYGEAPILRAMSHDGHVFVFFANSETGSWTALHVTAHGDELSACIEDYGQDADVVSQSKQ